MTDSISCIDMATQTPLPKVNVSFSSLNKCIKRRPNRPEVSINEKMYMNDRIIQTQMEELRKIDEKLKGENDYQQHVDILSTADKTDCNMGNVSMLDNDGHQSLDYDPLYQSINYRYNSHSWESLLNVQEDYKKEPSSLNVDLTTPEVAQKMVNENI